MIICPYIPNPSIKHEYIKRVHNTEVKNAQIQATKADEAVWLQEYYNFLIKNPPKE